MSTHSTSSTSCSSDGSKTNDSASVVEYRFPPNGLCTEPEPGLEHLHLYQSGGHHPVHLLDLLGDKKQYRIIGKLGTGGFGNVWLCRNVKRTPSEYVAVKILMAELSSDESNSQEAENIRRLQEVAKIDPDIKKYCLLPLDEFIIEGPNGTHQCFAYPVAGPSVGKISIRVPNPTNTLRKIVRQAVEAMAALHRHGVCHGDFRPGNVLLQLDGLNGLPEEQACEYFGWPYVCDVEVEEGYPNPGDSAPKYVVCPAEPDDDHLANAANLCVIDYGEAFDPLAPPEKGVGIPLPYCAPEILLEGKCGVASDIWALAATLFEIRTGYKLFSLCMNEVDDYLDLLVELLGPMPEPWWSTTWETRRVYWRDEADADGRAISATKRIVQSDFNILDQMRGNVLHFFMGEGQGWVRFPVPEEEKPIFEDLLKMMLRWKPEDRPSAEEVLKHPWFALEEEEVVQMEVEDGEFGDERSRDGSEDDETEDEMESDEEEDEEMSDAEMEVAQEANGESRSDQQEILKDNDKDDQKNENHELNHNQSHDPKDYLKSDQQEARKDNYGSDQKNDPKDDQKDDPKDDQKDDQQNVDEQVPYQRVEHMDCQQDDQDETPKPDSRVEKVKDNLLVSEKAGLLKVAVDTRFLAVAAWVKKTLRWSRK